CLLVARGRLAGALFAFSYLHPSSLVSPSHTSFFFFNDTATTEIYTLSLHDALPISWGQRLRTALAEGDRVWWVSHGCEMRVAPRSEEHTSELQSLTNIVCRLLLEKKKDDGRARELAAVAGRRQPGPTALAAVSNRPD